MRAYGVLGPRLIREENKGQKLFHLKSLWTDRSYYINPLNLVSLYSN
jgi:hypothetical protein